MPISEKNENPRGKEIVWRIKYSLINSVNLFSSVEHVELIPIIDRFLLLLQKNVGIEVIKDDKYQQPIFSFSERLNKQEIIKQWQISQSTFFVGTLRLDSGSFRLYVYNIDPDDENISKLEKADCDLFLDLINLINSDSGNVPMSKFLRKGLSKAFSINKQNFTNNQFSNFFVTRDILNEDAAILCKDSIREITEDAFSSFSHNPLMSNLFFKMSSFYSVIRYPYERGNRNYTAQILFSKSQKEIISTRFNNEFSIDTLEDPLDTNSTSLADRCFVLDTVQFGLPYHSKNQIELSKSDEARRELENSLYRKLLNNHLPTKVFFVPIHVNGTAWIATYQIFPQENPMGDWHLTFELYNQYTLLVAEKIRLKAKEKFYRLLFLFIEQAALKAKSLDYFLGECNNLMDILGAFFPYPVPFFNKTSNDNSLEDYLLGITERKFKIRLNQLWNNDIEHDKLESDEELSQIIAFCNQIGNSLKNLKLEEELRDASYSISHLLKNKLDDPTKEVQKIISALNFLVEEKGLQLDKANYLSHFTKFIHLSNDLRNTLTILDLIPKSAFEYAATPNYHAFLTQKQKYLLEPGVALDLMFELHNVIERKVKAKKVDLKLKECYIQPFVKDEHGLMYSPKGLIYNNCFIEAIINYTHLLNEGPLIVTVCRNSDNNLGICFKNEIENESQVDNDFIEVHRKDGFHGAIGYLNTVLKKVGIGIIKKQIVVENNKWYFQLGFFFKGLKLETYE